MNERAMAEAARKAAAKRFRGRKSLASKTEPASHDNLGREYARMAAGYMRILGKLIAECLGRLERAAKEPGGSFRLDAGGLTGEAVEAELRRLRDEWADRAAGFGLGEKLKRLGEGAAAMGAKDFRRAVRRTLGIDILNDYYKGEFHAAALETWVRANVGLIKTLGAETLGKVEGVIREGYLSGARTRAAARQIMAADPRSFGFEAEMSRDAYEAAMGEWRKAERHARFIARDQMAKLNAEVPKAQQTDAGVEEYEWRCSLDLGQVPGAGGEDRLF